MKITKIAMSTVKINILSRYCNNAEYRASILIKNKIIFTIHDRLKYLNELFKLCMRRVYEDNT